MQRRPGEGGTQAIPEERHASPGPVCGYEEGRGGRQGRCLGQTETSGNPCGSMLILSSLIRPTVRRRMAKGHRRNGTTVGAGPKTRKRSQEGKNVTGISAGLL